MSDEAPSQDTIAFAFARGLGPWLTPLIGKIPHLDAWPSQPAASEAQVRHWIDSGYNVGLRCGPRSGVVVIDDDQTKNGVPPEKRWIPPPTGLVAESPTGGRHYYYKAPTPCPGNSASKLAPYVDVRGDGGQVVYPGSSHPVVKLPYRWLARGEPGSLPDSVLAILADRPRTVSLDLTRPATDVPRGTGYAESALVREVARVRAAPAGSRNDQLNKSAFALGQLVAGGALTEAQVVVELTAAAKLVGDGGPGEDKKIAGTIRSGLTAGAREPRTAPERNGTATATRPGHVATPTDRPEVLVPGSHKTDAGYREQGTDGFAAEVIHHLPAGLLYRRAGVVGEIADAAFRVTSQDRIRTIIDGAARLYSSTEKDEDGETRIVTHYRPCSKDNAALVVAYAETMGGLRDLQHIAGHPVVFGSEFAPAALGWNDGGLYVTGDYTPKPMSVDEARGVLEDLVCDFPFASPADRANYFGLLLTPILRPAIPEPVPMHLIGSPIARSGKTKLAETVGLAILGRPTPALQIGRNEDETEKRILAALLAGRTVVNIDNIRDFLDSPSLASVLTANVYEGRELGHSRLIAVPNGLTVVGTGNNVHATDEIAKRIVPVMLQPAVQRPETRQDFKHALLRSYVESIRTRVLDALMALIEAWRAAHRPMAAVGFGGFERWSSVVGGILGVAGYGEHWLGNLATWRVTADDFGEELIEFVEAWSRIHGSEWVEIGKLYELAVELGVFDRQLSQTTEHGRRTAFGQRVINTAAGRVIDGRIVEIAGQGKRRRARLNPLAR